jgi:hypothetical protein
MATQGLESNLGISSRRSDLVDVQILQIDASDGLAPYKIRFLAKLIAQLLCGIWQCPLCMNCLKTRGSLPACGDTFEGFSRRVSFEIDHLASPTQIARFSVMSGEMGAAMAVPLWLLLPGK